MRRRRGACQERHWSHLEIFSAHGNLSHVQKISGAGDWLAFQPHQSPGVRHQRLAGPAPPPCHLFSNIFPSCTLSSPDHQKKDNWMVVWTLGQRHNGHPTILKIVSSARVFCNWGWVQWMNSPFGVVKRKLSFVPNKVLWERICHFLFQLWFGNAGGNLLGEAFFGVEIKKLFIKKKRRSFPIYIKDICSCKTRESRETLNRLYCTWCCCCQIKLDAALWDLGGRSVFLPFSRKFG